MITYRDMTFCVNNDCKKKCSRFLTPETLHTAEQYGLPVAMSSFICMDCNEDGTWEYKTGEDEEVS